MEIYRNQSPEVYDCSIRIYLLSRLTSHPGFFFGRNIPEEKLIDYLRRLPFRRPATPEERENIIVWAEHLVGDQPDLESRRYFHRKMLGHMVRCHVTENMLRSLGTTPEENCDHMGRAPFPTRKAR